MNMKESTVNAFKKMADLTNEKCKTCPVTEKYRCCDKMFCAMVAAELKKKGIHIEPTGNPEVPFMGDRGCVVPPEHRPFCSTFVCAPHLEEDRKFRREYCRTRDKIEEDPALEGATFPRLEGYKKK